MKNNKRYLVYGIMLGVIITSIVSVYLFNISNPKSENYYSQNYKSLNKTILLIGDSYGVNHESSSTVGNKWIGWADTFSVLFPDIPVYTSAVGGSGFLGGNNVDTFLDQLNTIGNKIDNLNEITDIIILGGYNDVSTNKSEEDINKAVKDFSKRAKELIPNAKISYMYVAVDYFSETMQISIDNYKDIFRKICKNNDITFVENSSSILNSKDLIFWDKEDANSGFHPNTKGSIKIVNKIVEYLVNNKIKEDS